MRSGWRLRRPILATLGGAVALGLVAAVVAQTSGGVFDMSFTTITGGGGESSAGGYTVMGSIGQPLAVSSTGGGYQMSGGILGGGATKYLRYLPYLSSDGVP